MAGAAVTGFHGGPSSCTARTVGPPAPIDPATGAFQYRGSGQIVANLTGTFGPDGRGSALGSGQANGGTRTKPRRCSFNLWAPSAFQFGYFAPIPRR